MSHSNSPITPRKPAIESLSSSKKEWHAVDSERSSQLLSTFGDSFMGRIEMLQENGEESLAGHYKVVRSAEDSYFVKVVEKSYQERELLAAEVTHKLKLAGVSVQTPSLIQENSEHYLLIAYPFIEGEHGSDSLSKEKAYTLGEKLAQLHRSFRELPENDKEAVKSQHQHKVDLITKWQEQAKNNQCTYGPKPERTQKLLSQEVECNPDSAQIIHGDLNQWNILFHKDNNYVTFLDFEDSLSTYAPIEQDIAFIIERLFLPLHSKANTLDTYLSVFSQGYKNQGDKSLFKTISLDSCLQLLHLKALAILCEMASSGIEVSNEEWQKFYDLEDQRIELADQLNHIEKLCKSAT